MLFRASSYLEAQNDRPQIDPTLHFFGQFESKSAPKTRKCAGIWGFGVISTKKGPFWTLLAEKPRYLLDFLLSRKFSLQFRGSPRTLGSHSERFRKQRF